MCFIGILFPSSLLRTTKLRQVWGSGFGGLEFKARVWGSSLAIGGLPGSVMIDHVQSNGRATGAHVEKNK